LLSVDHRFQDRKDLNYSRQMCREILALEAESASVSNRSRADLFAALMTDAATKGDKKDEVIDATPLCLLYGQGHQHFLDRLAKVPGETAPLRGEGRKAVRTTPAECLAEALFSPWHRSDPTSSFRWDPAEDVRYALMAGSPTDKEYKSGTQHGANRLATIGLAALTVVPQRRSGRLRPAVIGGAFGPGQFSFAWPIWREPATLLAIRSLLGHPDLRQSERIAHPAIDHVMT